MADKKPDTPPTADAVPGAPAPVQAKGSGLLPALLPIVLAPALTWAVAQFVLLPKITTAISAEPTSEKSAVPGKTKEKEKEKDKGHAAPKGGKGEGALAATATGYRFENVVVNLSGTMGTRYLKTSFLVTGAEDIVARFEAEKPQLGDVTLGVLSTLTLADLEEAGAKNLLRERLLSAYNQALGGKVAENLFFSDFVIQ
jgi:flagellar FliL protein